jgi:hypothetical protein
MTKKRQLTDAEIDAELAKLDLLPDAAARRETDALLKRLLSSPPQPFTPKPKKARSRKPAK